MSAFTLQAIHNRYGLYLLEGILKCFPTNCFQKDDLEYMKNTMVEVSAKEKYEDIKFVFDSLVILQYSLLI